MAQALGVIPVTIDISEVHTALAQHTIDAVDNTPTGIADNKFYLLLKYVARTNHVCSIFPFLASKKKVESMPPDLQKILRDETRGLIPFWRQTADKQYSDGLQILRREGMIFNDIDYPPFRKAMDPVYEALQSRIGGDLIQRVTRTAASAR